MLFDYSPAIVEALQHQLTKEPTVKSIPAELLDLCIRKKLKIEKINEKGFLGEKVSYKFHILDQDRETEKGSVPTKSSNIETFCWD